jgi:hypothetical protein
MKMVIYMRDEKNERIKLVGELNPKTYPVYRGADKSFARTGRKQATEDFEFHISYL